jgi:hypothetical protein
VKFRDANEKGSHWVDPLKAWGDVLAKQGHRQEALAKYDAALKYAPNWKQLKEARAAAAKQKTQVELPEADAREGQQGVDCRRAYAPAATNA